SRRGERLLPLSPLLCPSQIAPDTYIRVTQFVLGNIAKFLFWRRRRRSKDRLLQLRTRRLAHHCPEQRMQGRWWLRIRFSAGKMAARGSGRASLRLHARLLPQAAFQFRQRAWQCIVSEIHLINLIPTEN